VNKGKDKGKGKKKLANNLYAGYSNLAKRTARTA
jgi:hypothetical protein